MEDAVHQARKALTAYLERGEAALVKLSKGAVDEACELLLWRKAAFHNFRVAEDLAAKAQLKIADEETIQVLWQAIRQVDSELSVALREAGDRLHGELHKHQAARAKLRKFHSGHQGPGRFRSTV